MILPFFLMIQAAMRFTAIVNKGHGVVKGACTIILRQVASILVRRFRVGPLFREFITNHMRSKVSSLIRRSFVMRVNVLRVFARDLHYLVSKVTSVGARGFQRNNEALRSYVRLRINGYFKVLSGGLAFERRAPAGGVRVKRKILMVRILRHGAFRVARDLILFRVTQDRVRTTSSQFVRLFFPRFRRLLSVARLRRRGSWREGSCGGTCYPSCQLFRKDGCAASSRDVAPPFLCFVPVFWHCWPCSFGCYVVRTLCLSLVLGAGRDVGGPTLHAYLIRAGRTRKQI